MYAGVAITESDLARDIRADEIALDLIADRRVGKVGTDRYTLAVTPRDDVARTHVSVLRAVVGVGPANLIAGRVLDVNAALATPERCRARGIRADEISL